MGYLFIRAIIASAIPVLPDDDSRICCPGRRDPSFSASSTIDFAALSFTDPPGFQPSSLARIVTRGLGLNSLTLTIGVFPMRSRTLSYRVTSAPGDGGHKRERVAVADLRVELSQVADVIVVEKDVEVTVEAAVGS